MLKKRKKKVLVHGRAMKHHAAQGGPAFRRRKRLSYVNETLRPEADEVAFKLQPNTVNNDRITGKYVVDLISG